MLSISKPRKGAAAAVIYYLRGRLDYYLQGLDKEGQWRGAGAEKLGLRGPVEAKAFQNVLNGFSADGSQNLVQNAGDKDRQCYWDLAFSAPKPVGVLWAMAPEHIRRLIERAHREAVDEALAYLQQVAGYTRRGKGGKIIERTSLVFATFLEGTSRAQDPQPHTHCVLANVGVREDGTTGALKTEETFNYKLAAGERYQLALAARMHQWLGLPIEFERVAFWIVGVPKGVCRFFSKRQQQIEQVMEARGLRGAIAAKNVAVETRPAKEEIPADILFPYWQEKGRELGWGPEQALALLVRAQEKSQQPILHDEIDPRPGNTQPTNSQNKPEDAGALTTSRGKVTTKRSQAAQERREAKAASQRAFQVAIDRILADYRVPPCAELGSSRESTPGPQQADEKQLDHAPGASEHTKKRERADTNNGSNRKHTAKEDDRIEPEEHQRQKTKRTGHDGRDQGDPSCENTRQSMNGARESERRHQQFYKKPVPVNFARMLRELDQTNKEFVQVYLAILDGMHPEDRPRERLERLGFWLAHYMGATDALVPALFDWLIPGRESPLIHWELRRVFPGASWKALSEFRITALRIGNPPHRWTDTLMKIGLGPVQFAIQKRRMFPNAPRCSPLHGIEFPALRLRKKPTDSVPVKYRAMHELKEKNDFTRSPYY